MSLVSLYVPDDTRELPSPRGVLEHLLEHLGALSLAFRPPHHQFLHFVVTEDILRPVCVVYWRDKGTQKRPGPWVVKRMFCRIKKTLRPGVPLLFEVVSYVDITSTLVAFMRREVASFFRRYMLDCDPVGAGERRIDGIHGIHNAIDGFLRAPAFARCPAVPCILLSTGEACPIDEPSRVGSSHRLRDALCGGAFLDDTDFLADSDPVEILDPRVVIEQFHGGDFEPLLDLGDRVSRLHAIDLGAEF